MTKIDFVHFDNPEVVFQGSCKHTEAEVAKFIKDKKTFIITNEKTKAVFLITPEFMSKYLCVFTSRMIEK